MQGKCSYNALLPILKNKKQVSYVKIYDICLRKYIDKYLHIS